MKRILIAFIFAGLIALPAVLFGQQARKFIDPANMDLSIKPGDNFYMYANGNWIKNTPIPAKETRWGSFNILI